MLIRLTKGISSSLSKPSALAIGASLFTLKGLYPQQLSLWLNVPLRQEGYPSQFVTAEQKRIFSQKALQAKTRAELTLATQVFFQECRGWSSNVISLD